MDLQPYTYEPLPLSNFKNGSRQFRLLILLPGRGQSQLCGKLEVVSAPFPQFTNPTFNLSTTSLLAISLSTTLRFINKSYDALSYVWGDTSIRLPIILNGKQLLITTNLENSLRRLRHESEPRILWIDAICIDQHSMTQRSEQVQMKASIYGGASRVVVFWLGEEDEYTKTTFMTLRLITAKQIMKAEFDSMAAMGVDLHGLKDDLLSAFGDWRLKQIP